MTTKTTTKMIEQFKIDAQKRASAPAFRFKEMTIEMFEDLEAGKMGTGDFLMVDALKAPQPFTINVSATPNERDFHRVIRCYSGKTSWRSWGLQSGNRGTRKLREELEARIKKHGRTYYGIAIVDYENLFI